ncbi:MAG: type II secretion system protein GspG [Acidobacteriota bacterium]
MDPRRSFSAPACRLLILAALFVVGCRGEPQTPFDHALAQAQLADLFDVAPGQFRLLAETPTEEGRLLDFRMGGSRQLFQARFRLEKATWNLADLRTRDASGELGDWESREEILERLILEEVDKAFDTMDRMERLAARLELWKTQHDDEGYPREDVNGLVRLMRSSGQIKEGEGSPELDAWGRPFVYHASTDGLSYGLVSAGADGAWDETPNAYRRRIEMRELDWGEFDDPDGDLFLVEGSFVQALSE